VTHPMFLKMLLKKIHALYALKRPALALTLTAAAILCGHSWAADAAKAPAPISRLNDTGITWGGDYPKGINADCSAKFNLQQIKDFEKLKQLVPDDPKQGDILSQQDCKHGRDVMLNDNSDGAAGFVYRKIDKNGKILDASAKNWDCVLDEITGLLWEVKKGVDGVYGNRGLHDGDDLFTWYNPNSKTNGGLLGDWNSESKQCAGYKAGQPESYCNMDEFKLRVNQQGLCGFKDWRVPTLTELATVINYGHAYPAVDTAYFPHMQKELFIWSSTPSAGAQNAAWALSAEYGYTAPARYTDNYRVVLVRNWTLQAQQYPHSATEPQEIQQVCHRANMTATAPTSRFQQHDDGTVTDQETGLMWRRCVEGLKGKDCNKGKALEFSWAGALNYASSLNKDEGFADYRDWRVPNVRELSSLLELQCARPAINLEIFPNTLPAAHAWSSSPYNFYAHYSWYVNFESGDIHTTERVKPKQLRLVRGIN
jgi:hypothetical protein